MIRTTARRARKPRRCDRVGCSKLIERGEYYLSSVASPDHDGLGNLGWWRITECAECAHRYGRGHLLDRSAA